MKELNKKILVAVLLAGIMLAVPLVSAVPWTYPKNNDKFEEFAVVGSFSFLDIIFGDHQYVPSFDEVNKLVISWEENMLSYEISVDGKTYQLPQPFFVAPNVTEKTTLTFNLVVNDGKLSSWPDRVTIVADGENDGPVADAGADQAVAWCEKGYQANSKLAATAAQPSSPRRRESA